MSQQPNRHDRRAAKSQQRKALKAPRAPGEADPQNPQIALRSFADVDKAWAELNARLEEHTKWISQLGSVHAHNLNVIQGGFDSQDGHIFVLKRLLAELSADRGPRDVSAYYDAYKALKKDSAALKLWLELNSVEDSLRLAEEQRQLMAQAPLDSPDEEDVRTFGGDYGQEQVNESDEIGQRDGSGGGREHAESPQSAQPSVGV